MVWLNEQHSNSKVPDGQFGGSMCVCSACARKRAEATKTPHHDTEAPKHNRPGEGKERGVDSECICAGNLRLIIKEATPFFDNKFKNYGKAFIFFGVVYRDDDIYYGMIDEEKKVVLLSCVGSLKMHGFILD